MITLSIKEGINVVKGEQMKSRILLLLALMLCILCSCGKGNNDEAPILNENGKEELVVCSK